MLPLNLPETHLNPHASDEAAVCCADSQNLYSQRGYLLVSVSILIMVVVAMLSSVAFVNSRDGRFKSNFAAGQRLAHLAVVAHAYAQYQAYSVGTPLSGNVINAMNLPDNFSFTSLRDTSFSVEVIAGNQMPVAGTSTAKSASAYIHLRIRPKFGSRNATDNVALISGANKNGMGRVGLYQTAIPPGDLCDGSPTVVRWGNESSSCLNSIQAGALFNDVRAGDIIVPAWETAMGKMDREALMRYPQPERPDLNTMSVDLTMNGTEIRQAKKIDGKTLTQPITGVATIGTGKPTDRFIVTTGKKAMMLGPVIANQGLIASAPIGSGTIPMDVDSNVIIQFNGNVNIAEDMRQGATPLAINTANAVIVQKLGSDTRDLTITSRPGDVLTAGVKRIATPINGLTLAGSTPRLIISDTLNTQAATLTAPHFYAGRMDTYNSARFKNTGSTLVTINTKSLDQNGNADSLYVERANITLCDGKACPDNGTVIPPDGEL